MAISQEIYKVLESIVGGEYVSNDPVICEAYRSGPGGYENGLGYERVMTRVPGCVIMPKTTEEVQRIVKVCYRHDIPYVPYSTGFYGPRSHPHIEDALLIDLKRMNDFDTGRETLLRGSGTRHGLLAHPGRVYEARGLRGDRRGRRAGLGHRQPDRGWLVTL